MNNLRIARAARRSRRRLLLGAEEVASRMGIRYRHLLDLERGRLRWTERMATRFNLALR